MNDASRRQSVPNSISVPLRHHQNSKKRRRSLQSDPTWSETDTGKNATSDARILAPAPPLEGVVACLSGLEIDFKDYLHSVISSLGGQYVRDFDPKYVTHLILDEPKGPKYEHVKRSRQSWAEKIFIVKSSWVEACKREGRKVPEVQHQLPDVENKTATRLDFDRCESNKQKTNAGARGLPPEIQNASLDEACEWMLKRPIPKIFTYKKFLLHGFDLDHDSPPGEDLPHVGQLENSNLGSRIGDTAALPSDGKSTPSIPVSEKFSKLIRRAGGEILWEPDETTAIIVIHEDCPQHMWDDAKHFCRHHPCGPIAVTPTWVLCSLYHHTFEPCSFPTPRPRDTFHRKPSLEAPKTSNEITSSSNKNPVAKALMSSSIFRGDIFAIVRLTPPSGTIDFNRKEIETHILNNGGLLLSNKLYDAIRAEQKSQAQNDGMFKPDRKYYVVSSGGYHLDHANFHPLLSDLLKLGITIVPVTPIWIMACVHEKTHFDAEICPSLFQPQTWPIRLLPKTSENNGVKFLVSVTGFIDITRFAIIYMLKAIGATYTDNLRKKNTHLICKEPSGKKYDKSLEWGLHVVSLDWLYHIIRHGYKPGSEEKFSFAGKEEKPNVDNEKQLEPGSGTKNISVHFSLAQDQGQSDNAESGAEKIKKEDTKDSNGTPESKSLGDGAEVTPTLEAEDFDNLAAFEAKEEDMDNFGELEKEMDTSHGACGDASKERSRRLQSALDSLRTPGNLSNKPQSIPATSLRRKIPPIVSHKPLQQSQSFDESNDEAETQQTIRVDADIDRAFAKSFSGDGTEVPLSQTNDEELIGESQVVWFPPTNS